MGDLLTAAFVSKKKKNSFRLYSRTSVIRTPKEQSEVSVLEKCPYRRGHYDNVTFMTLLTFLRVQ